MLENVRFYKEETKNDPVFAKKVRFASGSPCTALTLGCRLLH